MLYLSSAQNEGVTPGFSLAVGRAVARHVCSVARFKRLRKLNVTSAGLSATSLELNVTPANLNFRFVSLNVQAKSSSGE